MYVFRDEITHKLFGSQADLLQTLREGYIGNHGYNGVYFHEYRMMGVVIIIVILIGSYIQSYIIRKTLISVTHRRG